MNYLSSVDACNINHRIIKKIEHKLKDIMLSTF